MARKKETVKTPEPRTTVRGFYIIYKIQNTGILKPHTYVYIHTIHKEPPMKKLLLSFALILIFYPTASTFASEQTEKDSALYQAAKDNSLAGVQAMLTQNANPNTKYKNMSLPLSFATRHGNIEMVKVLLKYGADINAKGVHGETALIWATYRKHISVVKLLIEKGSDINKQERIGFSPLMIAAGVGSIKIVNILLRHGADRSAQNKEHETAYDVALHSGNKKAANLIKNWQEKKKQ